MKTAALFGLFFLSSQAFGLILEPGESWRFGRTIVTCSEGEKAGSRCTLTQESCFSDEYRVKIEEDRLECLPFEQAMKQLKELKEAEVCQ